MIIDKVLDRKDYGEYNAKEFYLYCNSDDCGHDIARAMDGGTNTDAQREICKYITKNGYPKSICNYINSQNWI